MSYAKLYPAAPLETVTAFEERLENKLNDVSSFNISVKYYQRNDRLL